MFHCDITIARNRAPPVREVFAISKKEYFPDVKLRYTRRVQSEELNSLDALLLVKSKP